MRFLILFLVLFSMMFGDEYWTIDAYHALHPEQKKIFKTFDTLVQSQPQPLKIVQKEPVVITFLYPGKEVSDYWMRSKKALLGRLDALGISYVLQERYFEGANTQEQITKLKYILKTHSDYLILSLDPLKHQKLLSFALNSPKPKVILHNITTPLKVWEGKQPLMYTGFDHLVGAKLLANYSTQTFVSDTPFGLLYFHPGYISHLRGDGFLDLIQTHKALHLVGAFYTQGTKESAKKAAIALIDKAPHVRFIYSCSTDVAVGVTEAIRERKMEKTITTNGFGGGSVELQMIDKGEIAVTVMRMNDDSSIAIAEAIKLDLLGQSSQIPTIYTGRYELIDSETPKAHIQKLEERAFRYSGHE